MLTRFLHELLNKIGNHDAAPSIKGLVSIEVRERGKLVGRQQDYNIFTLTGREFFIKSAGLQAWSPLTRFRSDNIAYIGVGIGTQPEVSSVGSLVAPVPYVAGEFLAPLDAPVLFPLSGGGSTVVARFMREFSMPEISFGGLTVTLTEAGLYTNGDPAANWAVPAPTDFVTAAGRAPVAYKTFEPFPKTASRNVQFIWDLQVV